MRRPPLPPCALALAACLGACDGGGGDSPTTPAADAYGACARLAALGGPATWLDPDDMESVSCKVPADRRVCVSGLAIVAIDRFDETGKAAVGNYYVQDAAKDADYSGMTVFGPSFSPPDLRLAPGDVADIFGLKTEFLGPSSGRFGGCRTLPEITGTLSFRFDGSRALEPKVIPAKELAGYDTARTHLGKLVKIENVTIANDGVCSAGRYTADIDVGGGIPVADVPRISNELFDIEGLGGGGVCGDTTGGGGGGGGSGGGTGGLKAGMTFKSITGVVTYFYGFKIAPRSAADLESSQGGPP